MSDDDRRTTLMHLLAETRRRNACPYYRYFPDTGPLRRELYPAELEQLPEELQAMVQDFEVFEANIHGVRDGKTDKARRVRTESKLKALEMTSSTGTSWRPGCSGRAPRSG